MDELEWWEFDNSSELAEQAAGDIGFVIESALEAHGGARVALPGEAGLDPVFSALAKSSGFEWSKVSLVPTADRLVALTAQDSRYRMLEGWFGAKGAEILSLVDESALGNPVEAARLADARLSLLRWPLDCVCLGIDEVKARDGDLVTLTAPTLTAARTVMIVIAGAKKRQVLEQAIKDGPLSPLPIGRLLASIESPVDIFWSPDEA
jgi:6-phosphogluconolactonase